MKQRAENILRSKREVDKKFLLEFRWAGFKWFDVGVFKLRKLQQRGRQITDALINSTTDSGGSGASKPLGAEDKSRRAAAVGGRDMTDQRRYEKPPATTCSLKLFITSHRPPFSTHLEKGRAGSARKAGITQARGATKTQKVAQQHVWWHSPRRPWTYQVNHRAAPSAKRLTLP